ncbi:DUF2812 domain-containing protein [Oceanirhabdus sp. W0125-5]|uniref:DUF2812 domain-containing protein n=1 Tax=Oceanirhabdus sp. W0125-5 TaxID=2999116 RepID=UPI0022F2AE08|nr:DUF2812 domain-containing protein [Oceanirhabdus sp. W0125-5]WBW97840.1 DUF2812 domain-containing protein [Oceanirhabdus sp. W0125-5]
MKHSRKKFKFSMGLGFAEEKEMKMLSNMAAKGWIFYKFKGLGYKFKKGESQDLVYNLDSMKISGEDKSEYLEVFKAAGWDYVCSVGDSIHFFSAKTGTLPIYSDKHTKQERNIRTIKDTLKAAGYIILFSIILLLAQHILKGIFKNHIVNKILFLVTAFCIGYAAMLVICVLFIRFKKRKI